MFGSAAAAGHTGVLEQPMLIIHGKRVLVPFEAATEHHRIIPERSRVLDDNTMVLERAMLAPKTLSFSIVSSRQTVTGQ
jgi:hypothetical protein